AAWLLETAPGGGAGSTGAAVWDHAAADRAIETTVAQTDASNFLRLSPTIVLHGYPAAPAPRPDGARTAPAADRPRRIRRCRGPAGVDGVRERGKHKACERPRGLRRRRTSPRRMRGSSVP